MFSMYQQGQLKITSLIRLGLLEWLETPLYYKNSQGDNPMCSTRDEISQPGQFHHEPPPVLPNLLFSPNLGLFFVDLRFFLKTCGLLVLTKICLFFADFCNADCFFSNCITCLLFQFTEKQNLGVFLCKFAHFGLVFSNLPPCFCV